MNIQNSAGASLYYDMSHLEKLAQMAKSQSDENSDQALEFAANQFESMFLQMMFAEIRKTEAVFQTDTFNDSDTEFYKEMYDNQMAENLSKNSSIGLKEIILEQLKTRA